MKVKFLMLFVIVLFLNVAVVSANDLNLTDEIQHIDGESFKTDSADNLTKLNNSDVKNVTPQKTTPKITLESSNVYSKDTLKFDFKDLNGTALKSKNLTVNINNKNYKISTNSKGEASLKISLEAKTYKLTVSFGGDDKFKPVSKTFNIKVSKMSTKIDSYKNFVIKDHYLYFFLTDSNDSPVSGKKISLKFNGKTYSKKTNKKGQVAIKIKSDYKKYTISAKFKGDNQFKSSSKTLKFYVVKSKSLTIGNSKLLTNGFLRIYLKDLKSVWKKNILVKIGGKKISKKTNSEGIVVVKPSIAPGKYMVIAKLGKYYTSKRIMCYEANVKDPLKENITLKNGIPDVDVMPGNYVMGDENGKYTLKKSQYREVIKRDSYSLFLNNKLTKYTFFKTKSHPNLNHIIKREKWNVIERAINTKIVKANKNNYWPGSITVSLKGKSCTYPEVRDVQDTSYTCGPTSGSVCSQVLRNYVCEKYLAHLGGSKKGEGTPCSGIKYALEKNNFKCTYFYKDSFNYALDELKKGGCALVFHTKHHYVSILDISKNGKKVLVSNSYGNYYNIKSKWLTVNYMKTRFVTWDDSLVVKLNYKLSDQTKNDVNCFYNSFGANWARKNTNQKMGMV